MNRSTSVTSSKLNNTNNKDYYYNNIDQTKLLFYRRIRKLLLTCSTSVIVFLILFSIIIIEHEIVCVSSYVGIPSNNRITRKHHEQRKVQHYNARFSRVTTIMKKDNIGKDVVEEDTSIKSRRFSSDLIRALDLNHIMIVVANYATTRRGQQAILRLVGEEDEIATASRVNEEKHSSKKDFLSRKKAMLELMAKTTTTLKATTEKDQKIPDYYNDLLMQSSSSSMYSKEKLFYVTIASNESDARYQYELVEQAMFAIKNTNNNALLHNVSCPTLLFRDDSDTNYYYEFNKKVEDNQLITKGDDSMKENLSLRHWKIYQKKKLDDYDEWMYLSPNHWKLEHILQAEKLIDIILKTIAWSQEESTMTWMPLLANIVNLNETSVNLLKSVLFQIVDSVRIKRVRTIMDPNGRSTYVFHLSEQKYPILGIFHQKQSNIQDQIYLEQESKTTKNKKLEELKQDLISIEEEIKLKEQEIIWGLVMKVYEHLDVINFAFNRVAALDVIFAKARFGIDLNGKIPEQHRSSSVNKCSIHVTNFIHPLLLLQNNGLVQVQRSKTASDPNESGNSVRTGAVPIDLHLSEKIGEHALIISGSNGGGKTIALKSFGLVALFAKLGIPIPTFRTNKHPLLSLQQQKTAEGKKIEQEYQKEDRIIVDYFEEILTSVGDKQDVDQGESTYTGHLKKYSSIMNTVSENKNHSSFNTLVLVDELGSGTEASVGGAIGQAFLENLLQTESCRIVATTHSSRLKALSFQNDSFRCAAVLLSDQDDSINSNHSNSNRHLSDQSPINSNLDSVLQHRRRRPSYRLEYDIIGESYGLDAAARCSSPTFPTEVIRRAAELLQANPTVDKKDLLISAQSKPVISPFLNDTQNKQERPANTMPWCENDEYSLAYNLALNQSRKKQLELTELAWRRAEADAFRIAEIQKAMLILAKSYEKHWAQLEQRTEMCYDDLKSPPEKGMSVEVLGNKLSEVRVVRARAKSDAELLAEKGLKTIPDSYSLREGEMVVILTSELELNEKEIDSFQEGEWDASSAESFITGTVASRAFLSAEEREKLRPDDVAVLPSSFPLYWSLNSEKERLSSQSWDKQVEAESLFRPLVFKRYQLAFWDYDSVWDDYGESTSNPSTSSLRDSKRRFNEIVKSLKKPEATIKKSASYKPDVIQSAGNSHQASFTSSRERKAAKKRRLQRKR